MCVKISLSVLECLSVCLFFIKLLREKYSVPGLLLFSSERTALTIACEFHG